MGINWAELIAGPVEDGGSTFSCTSEFEIDEDDEVDEAERDEGIVDDVVTKGKFIETFWLREDVDEVGADDEPDKGQ